MEQHNFISWMWISFGASDVHLCAQTNYVDLYMGEQNVT